jgi:hypothetical protein
MRQKRQTVVHHENIHTATANSVTNVARPETTPTAAAAQSDGVGSMGGRARGILRFGPLFDTENLTQLAQFEVSFCDFAESGVSRIKGLLRAYG